MKTLIVQNYWTPYRSDLFGTLSKLMDIEVLYLGKIGSDRLWNIERVDYKIATVPSRKLGPFTLSNLDGLDFSLYDQLVILEHLENIFSIQKIIKEFSGRYYLWTGMFENMYPDKPFYGKVVDLFKKIYRNRLYRAKGYFAYSSLTREMLLGKGIPFEKIAIISQASRVPDIVPWNSINQRGNISGPLRILSLGYLRKEKNNDFLIKVCKKFSKNDLVLTIVGEGPEKKRLKRIAGDNVTFKGYVDGEKKFLEYMRADVFILPTIRDPWALTVNEAMSCGLPIICSSRAGARDVIRGNGFVIDPFNESELFSALKTFVDNRTLCLEMGQKSLEIIRDYTVEYAATQLAGILSK